LGGLQPVSQARTGRLLFDAESAARLRHKLALMDIAVQHVAALRSHFNPNQPRVPAGSPDGGQWTSSGGETGNRLAAADKPRFGRGAALAIILEIAKQVIERHRSENGLWDLFGHKHGTVAFTTIDGTDIFGSNSRSPTYTSVDRVSAVRMRDILVKKYPTEFSAERIERMPNDAIFHAKTTVMLRAARQNGGALAERTLTVHVDEKLCNNCEVVLPYVGLELGNPTVTFVDATGLTRTMRDGNWLKSEIAK
jgi:hypothetical protein